MEKQVAVSRRAEEPASRSRAVIVAFLGLVSVTALKKWGAEVRVGNGGSKE